MTADAALPTYRILFKLGPFATRTQRSPAYLFLRLLTCACAFRSQPCSRPGHRSGMPVFGLFRSLQAQSSCFQVSLSSAGTADQDSDHVFLWMRVHVGSGGPPGGQPSRPATGGDGGRAGATVGAGGAGGVGGVGACCCADCCARTTACARVATCAFAPLIAAVCRESVASSWSSLACCCEICESSIRIIQPASTPTTARLRGDTNIRERAREGAEPSPALA